MSYLINPVVTVQHYQANCWHDQIWSISVKKGEQVNGCYFILDVLFVPMSDKYMNEEVAQEFHGYIYLAYSKFLLLSEK